jgi:chromosome segregation ATPase
MSIQEQLAALLADPKLPKRRLDEIIAIERELATGHAEVNQLTAKIAADRKAADKARAETQELNSRIETSHTLRVEMERRAQELEQRRKDLEEREKSFIERATATKRELEARAAEVERNEIAVINELQQEHLRSADALAGLAASAAAKQQRQRKR